MLPRHWPIGDLWNLWTEPSAPGGVVDEILGVATIINVHTFILSCVLPEWAWHVLGGAGLWTTGREAAGLRGREQRQSEINQISHYNLYFVNRKSASCCSANLSCSPSSETPPSRPSSDSMRVTLTPLTPPKLQ